MEMFNGKASVLIMVAVIVSLAGCSSVGTTTPVTPGRELQPLSAGWQGYFDINWQQVHGHGVSLRTLLEDALPLIQGDRIQLQQVILNLMINAIEAMKGIGDAPRELSISSAKDDSQSVLVAVRDSGPGLNPGSLDRLFHAPTAGDSG
jgi:signal transduction histidine kinase